MYNKAINFLLISLSTVQCSTADCQITFHPSCARDAGLYMNTKRIGTILQHKAYCGRHSIEQRKVSHALNCLSRMDPATSFLPLCHQSSSSLHSYLEICAGLSSTIWTWGGQEHETNEGKHTICCSRNAGSIFAWIYSTFFYFTNYGSNNLDFWPFKVRVFF
jgi:hypothetical protein